MSVFDWQQVRQSAIRRFHDAPDAELEQRIINVFREHPALVVEAVAHISARFDAGKIRAPWVILAKHVEQAVTPLENVSATDTRDRTRQIGRAEQWTRAAGKHFDSPTELTDELFGERGILRPWPELEERMIRLWEEVRPEGELIDRQGEERAQRWMATRVKAATSPEPDPDDIPF